MPTTANKPQRILRISAKCADLFSAQLKVGDRWTGDYSGYVPNFMPGEHYGDYVCLDIDVDTGQILDWKRPTQKALDEVFGPKEEA